MCIKFRSSIPKLFFSPTLIPGILNKSALLSYENCQWFFFLFCFASYAIYCCIFCMPAKYCQHKTLLWIAVVPQILELSTYIMAAYPIYLCNSFHIWLFVWLTYTFKASNFFKIWEMYTNEKFLVYP